jgi:lipoate---protein ligase
MVVRLIDAGNVSSIRSQTIYHGLGYAQSGISPNTIVFATPTSRYMCIGFFQDAEQELDLQYCRLNDIPVIRRETGGGSVYIDDNQLFVQWIFRKGQLPGRVGQWFQLFTKPMIETFKFFGIDAYYHPINDVHVAGKKIVGTGAGTIGDAEVITGNFMFNFDHEVMANALKVPNELFREEIAHLLKEYVTTIKAELNFLPEIDELKRVYISRCEEILGLKIKPGEFTEKEIKTIEELDRKFKTEDWLLQTDNPENSDRLVKIHTGVWLGYTKIRAGKTNIEATIGMKENFIDRIKISMDENKPDFSIIEFEQSLIGVELIPEKLKLAVDAFYEKTGNNHEDITSNDWVKIFMKIRGLQSKAAGNG